MKLDESQYDIFLAHAGPDLGAAQRLKTHLLELDPNVKVFIDRTHLQPGQPWPSALTEAQASSAMTVALLSRHSSRAHYLQEEIVRGLDHARVAPNKHRLVPVLLEGDRSHLLYGTASLQWLDASGKSGLQGSAAEVLKSLAGIKQVYWDKYDGLFDVEGFQIAYLPILNPANAKPSPLAMTAVNFDFDYKEHSLDPAFMAASGKVDFSHVVNIPSCGLSSYEVSASGNLAVRFFKTSYVDYLRSGELLDTPIPGRHGNTFRTKFGDLVRADVGSLMSMQLTNICGTGVFVVSRDGYLITTRHSYESHVYPGRWTFSASGTMKWGASPNPFTEALVKCRAEINHQLDLDRTRLIAFGADARKLFFQFSFTENSSLSSNVLTQQINQGVELGLIKPVVWKSIAMHSASNVIDELVQGCWEPAAEAALMSLCIEKFGREKVNEAIGRRELDWRRRRLTDEWDFRAGVPGLLAVMSVRYPANKLKSLSEQFSSAVMDFMGPDIQQRNIVEFGCGIGRVTARLIRKASHVTALDLCDRMIQRAQAALGNKANQVTFVRSFAQNYKPRKRADVAISCLLLIHNVAADEFEGAVKTICRAAKTVFVFEDVTQGRKTSSHTCLRTKEEIRAAFAKCGFRLVREAASKLSRDTIVFLKFVENQPHK